MLPPFWGYSPMNALLLQQMQQQMEQMQRRFDAVFRTLLSLDPRVVAQTPADVVYTENKLQLLHYHPSVEQPHAIPLLIVPSVLTRYYALDLLPGQSLIEYLVKQGFDVYLLDWGSYSPEDRYVTFDEYIAGYLHRVVQQVCKQSGQDRISVLGYSLGGTFAAIYSALHGQHVRNLVAIAAPINFHDTGVLSQWTRKERFNVDLVVDTLGNMPTALMQASFRMLKPVTELAQQLALAETSGDLDLIQDYLAMQSWIMDTPPWIGEAYRTYIKQCYHENQLVQGKLVVNRQPIDLGKIDSALLTITAAKDQICPPSSAAVLHDLVSSADKQIIELPGSHVGIVTGPRASQQLWPQLAEWLDARSTVDPRK